MSTSKGSGRSRRKFTPEFKAEVVAMVEASGGKIAQVAREMRLHDSSVGNWVREAREAKAGNGPATARQRPSVLRFASFDLSSMLDGCGTVELGTQRQHACQAVGGQHHRSVPL